MTNYKLWSIYTRNLTSPQSWVDFGWYFLISACLQRRVWLYDENMPVFANQYILLVGPPGLGKGIVLDKIADFLKFHKYEKGKVVRTSLGEERPPLFPVGADSITFEKLMAKVASSARYHPVGNNAPPYAHCSFAFVLEELASLFKHKTSDVIKFLQNAYDCKDYDYETKHQGEDRLRKLCFCFIAGTQPDFLKEASEAKIFGQGFASRALFLFETKERFDAFHIATFDPEQLEAKAKILEYVKRLATLYGRVTYDTTTYKYLENWYSNVFLKQRDRAHPKMLEYYARKKIMMIKLAMAMHFSESLDMTIPCETFVRAISLLDSVEPQMEQGLTSAGRNELHQYARKILRFIHHQRSVEKRLIIMQFSSDLDIEEIDKTLQELEQSGQVKYDLINGRKVYRAS